MKRYFCDKCGKEIKEYETIWKLDGCGNFGSFADGEHLHKHFCDTCTNLFINSIDNKEKDLLQQVI